MAKLDTPTARSKLTARPEPHWHRIDTGKYLGYRAGADTWIARSYRGAGRNEYHTLGALPGFTDAKVAAETWFATLDQGASAHYTIDSAIADYVEHRRVEKGERSALEAKQTLHKWVLPKFTGRELASITTVELKRWRNAFVPRNADEQAQRRAKDSCNRVWATFRAALAVAFQDGKVATDTPWRRIKPFEDVGATREFYPTPEQVKALLAACDDALRPLVHAAVLTGFRLQALTLARVADFDAADGTLNIRRDKKHERIAALSTAATALFKEQARDKLPSAHLFLRGDGLPWQKSHQHRPFRAACTKAKLPREFVVYSLRHYFVSRALLAGVPATALAKAVGTSPAMIAKHYGKFIRTDVRDMLDRVEVA